MKLLSQVEQALVHSFWFLPPDLHERQRTISNMIQHGDSVLDVGGEQAILEKQPHIKNYHTINIAEDINQTPRYLARPEKHMFYDGKHLPFDDNTFDTVVCIDVLEHVPPQARKKLVAEMLRVAKHSLICSAPLGTPEHIQGEKDLLKSITDTKEAQFLEDHLEKGLPTPKEVQGWAEFFNGKLSFAGDFRLANRFYMLQRTELSHSVLNHLFFFAKMFAYFGINLALYPFLVGKKTHSPSTNRFYLEISKSKAA